jgi:hypothetical protein
VIRSKYLLFIAAAALLIGCQKAANTTSETTTNTNSGAAISSSNSAGIAGNASTSDTGDVNGTPTEVYKAAYTARKNCDMAGLKKVLANEFLTYIGKMAKMDKKSLDDELKEICEEPQAPTAQARNEKIDGNRASIEYLDEDGQWRPMDFIREDAAWKLSLPTAPGEDEPENPLKDKDDNRS